MKKILAIFTAMLLAVSCLTVMPFAHDVTVTLGGTEYIEESVLAFTNVMDSDKNPYAVAGFEPASETYTFARNNNESKGIASADAIEDYWADGYYLKLVVSAGTVSSTTLRLQEDGGNYAYAEVNGVAADGATYYDLGEAWDKFTEAGYAENYGRGNLRVKDTGLTVASLEIVKLSEDTSTPTPSFPAFTVPSGEEQVYTREMDKTVGSWGVWWLNNDADLWQAINVEGAKLYAELDCSWVDAGYWMQISMNNGGEISVSGDNGTPVPDNNSNIVCYDIAALAAAYTEAGGEASAFALQTGRGNNSVEYTILNIYVTHPEATVPGPGAANTVPVGNYEAAETHILDVTFADFDHDGDNSSDKLNPEHQDYDPEFVPTDKIVIEDGAVIPANCWYPYLDFNDYSSVWSALATANAYVKVTTDGNAPNLVIVGANNGPTVGWTLKDVDETTGYVSYYFSGNELVNAHIANGNGYMWGLHIQAGGSGFTWHGAEIVTLDLDTNLVDCETIYGTETVLVGYKSIYWDDDGDWQTPAASTPIPGTLPAGWDTVVDYSMNKDPYLELLNNEDVYLKATLTAGAINNIYIQDNGVLGYAGHGVSAANHTVEGEGVTTYYYNGKELCDAFIADVNAGIDAKNAALAEGETPAEYITKVTQSNALIINAADSSYILAFEIVRINEETRPGEGDGEGDEFVADDGKDYTETAGYTIVDATQWDNETSTNVLSNIEYPFEPADYYWVNIADGENTSVKLWQIMENYNDETGYLKVVTSAGTVDAVLIQGSGCQEYGTAPAVTGTIGDNTVQYFAIADLYAFYVDNGGSTTNMWNLVIKGDTENDPVVIEALEIVDLVCNTSDGGDGGEGEEEEFKLTGWFMTGDKYHAMIVGHRIITMEHTFDSFGNCIFCRHHVDVEEIEVEPSYESETEETEEDTVVVEDTNPTTGMALALVPAVIALAVVAFKKR